MASPDLIFYLGCVLYPQDMSKGVDNFFEAEKSQRVKGRKVLRAKIKKVHEVLYKYSHEKMEYFVSVPELAHIFTYFAKSAPTEESDDAHDDAISQIMAKCEASLLKQE
jgi:hypothetical protein